jgi:CRP/FNR family transcriptional regulator, cyclic AMP receptor protein
MEDIKTIVGFLHRVPLFHSLKNRQLETLAKRFVERNYPAGKVIVTQGQGGEGFFVVASGKCQAVRERSDGEKVVVNTFETGDFFGELALLDENGLRTATVTATEDTKCLVLTRWDFTAILKEDAEMGIDILQEMARRFRIALDVL